MSIVITGASVVSPIGSSYSEFMDELDKGTIGIDHIQNFDTTNYPISVGAEAKQNGKVILTDIHVDRKEVFVFKAIEDLFNTCPQIQKYKPEQRMLLLGSGMDYFNFTEYANSQTTSKSLREYRNHPKQTIDKIKERFSIFGFDSINVSACVASSQSIGLAFRALRQQKNSIAITGGFDSMLSPLAYMGFYKLGALSEWTEPKKACRPFDKNRSGIVLGEGAAVFCLQNDDEVQSDSILAEIAGFGSTCDAYMVTDPNPEGRELARAAELSMKDANVSAMDIDCVHLHGTGTYKNAIAETNAMRILFGSRFDQIPVFSLKAQVGHLIGACGAIEMLGVIHSLATQTVLPTPNCEETDPEVPLYVVKDKPLSKKIQTILKLNAAFGGQNTALIVKKYQKQ